MKTREERVEFDRNYCVHYNPRPGLVKHCNAGMDIENIQCVRTGEKGIKWGPCIEGHTLACATDHCPKWERRSVEQAEKRADETEAAVQRMTLVFPAVNAWRNKAPADREGVIECPVCKGRLHLSQSSYNGHVRGQCETADCVNWIE